MAQSYATQTIDLIISNVHKICVEKWETNYVQTIHDICLLHCFEQVDQEQPKRSCDNLVKILAQCFGYLEQLMVFENI